jgi:hypothetical protein
MMYGNSAASVSGGMFRNFDIGLTLRLDNS